MLGEGGQGLPRELAGDGQSAERQAVGGASGSSWWSEWVLLQEGDGAEGAQRGCSARTGRTAHPRDRASPAGR